GSTFTGWGGDCMGTGDCMVNMSAAHNVTATFDGISYPLAVTKSGMGSGTVSSVPSGIDCGATCTAQFGDGQMVQLTAVPAMGSTFTTWGGDCATFMAMPVCTITVAAAANVSAQFDIGMYNVSVTLTGMGSVSSVPAGINCGATCTASFSGGAMVTLN